MAAYQGTSQHIFEHLFTKNQCQPRPPPTPVTTQLQAVHHSPTSTKQESIVPRSAEVLAAEDVICDICAFDILEYNVVYERDITWYRLAFAIYPDNARPPGISL
jgi:hypothetical protein